MYCRSKAFAVFAYNYKCCGHKTSPSSIGRLTIFCQSHYLTKIAHILLRNQFNQKFILMVEISIYFNMAFNNMSKTQLDQKYKLVIEV